MKPVVILGNNQSREQVREILANQGHHDILIVTPEEFITDQMGLTPAIPIQEPIRIQPAPNIHSLYGEKEFVCKGKHQYREVVAEEKHLDGGIMKKVEWVCQCGKKLD